MLKTECESCYDVPEFGIDKERQLFYNKIVTEILQMT
jgi:hypothetical protein